MAPTDKKTPKTRSAIKDVVTRDYTVNLHKRTHDRSFKKRSPWAIKSIVSFAERTMGTKDVRLDPKLNQQVWSRGVRSPPRRIRVRLERKRNDAEDAKEKLYTYASYVPCTNFKGTVTEVVDTEA